MGMFKVGSSQAPEQDIEAGDYPATVVNVTQETITVEFEDRDVFKWHFEIPTEDGDPIEISGLTSRTISPKSKAFAYLVALLGASHVQPDAEFGLEDVIGKTGIVTVGENKRGWMEVKNLHAAPRTAAKPTKAATNGSAPVAATPSPRRAAAVDTAPAPRKTVRATVGEDDLDDLPF